jgi:hypothetical protein
MKSSLILSQQASTAQTSLSHHLKLLVPALVLRDHPQI